MVEVEQVPLSALQHWQYCPRQCCLINLEQAFDDNVHTLRGQALQAPTKWCTRQRDQGFTRQ